MSDLFSEQRKEECLIDEFKEWTDYFTEEMMEEVSIILSTVNYLRDGKTIYPNQEDILKIFKDLHPNDVKIIIIGQDPYHDGNATGYAFACKKSLSPSLEQIWNSFRPFKKVCNNAQADLKYLVEQGVMLLNTTLTVVAGKPFSHQNIGWQRIIIKFIKNFSNAKKGIVFMLWGGYAKQLEKHIDSNKHYILKDVHPVYASRSNIKWNCNHFNFANLYLKKKNLKQINWR